jgi:transposase-like protein
MDSEMARIQLETRLWPHGPVCPICASGERIGTRKAGFYRCYGCKEDFTVRTNTIIERSHIPLDKWLQAIQLVAAHGELESPALKLSTLKLAEELEITQKSALSMLRRIREACNVVAVSANIVDQVLAYRPQPKSEAAQLRKRKAAIHARTQRAS